MGKSTLTGEVMHIDSFGNIITNFRRREFESMGIKKAVKLKLKNTELKLKFCKVYGEVNARQLLVVIGSHSFLEISINQGNAAKNFQTRVGDKVTLHLP